MIKIAPFKSEKQRRYLWMHHPEIAKKWTKEHGSKPVGKKKKKKKKSSADYRAIIVKTAQKKINPMAIAEDKHYDEKAEKADYELAAEEGLPVESEIFAFQKSRLKKVGYFNHIDYDLPNTWDRTSEPVNGISWQYSFKNPITVEKMETILGSANQEMNEGQYYSWVMKDGVGNLAEIYDTEREPYPKNTGINWQIAASTKEVAMDFLKYLREKYLQAS